ncbi:choice-of-anchor J domain-containing protein [Carboxylicivirga linearis]|uniref:Choice-of-anchor J domain-containing protein n=1 Tax=Carboxylicivirga linearis TaxID=1628157 RepID=A0ABS5JXS8_9BACT|nr:choice-of-anchor J domain-containing protein [Carboxylicivirga linearis]MBS2099693.1 choice-of-anchor J domain-containing protein [Carboxylicivirga linearis]
MRKNLRMLMIICLAILSFKSFGQKLDKSSPALIKSVREGKQMVPVSPEKMKGKPLDSEIYLRTYKPLPPSPFEQAQIGFRKMQNDVSLQLAEELGDEILYSNMIYSDTWSDLAIYDIPYGIYSFSANENTDFTIHYENIGLNCNAGVYANNKFYGIHPITLFGALNGIGYFVVNTETWETERNYIVDDAGYEDMASTMTFDPTTNNIFALRYNEELTGFNWATLDTASFTFNNLADWSGSFTPLTLSTTPDGTIYCIGINGNLYTLDKADGTPTLVGATGVYPANYSQSAVYNGHTGQLLWCAMTYTGSHMYTVDLSTGEASRLFTFENNEQMVGLFTKSTSAMDEAPAAISDLTITPEYDGALTGTINFTVPSLTYSGIDLNENLNVITKIDGIVVDEQELAPASVVNLPYTLTNENHTFSVITSNSVGVSPISSITKYIGYDTPDLVKNLSYSINEGTSSLSWDTPTEGSHGGYIDPSLLYYTVVRLPDNVTVANHLTTSSFSETMPSLMARYSYQITAYNGSDKMGLTATTNEIIYGDGFKPPYTQTFEDANSLEYFNIIDNNGDDNTWQLLSDVIAYWPNYNEDIDGDDWLITPAFELKANVKYKLTFSTKALWSPSIESMKVAIGTSPSDIETFTNEIWNNAEINFYEYTDQIVEFSVATDGKYHIGFYAFSAKVTGTGLYIDDISLDKIGAFEAPAKVSDLTVTPDANLDLKATISFTAPSVNLNNETLSEISQIDIYRNNDFSNSIHTFTNSTAGETLSWLDENVPFVGYNTYTVVPSNASGEGEYESTTEFLGIFTPPYSETFDTKSSMDMFTFLSLATETSNWSYNDWSQCLEGANWSNIANEWVFLPSIKLKANTVYEFSMGYTTYGLGSFELTLGTAARTRGQNVVDSFSTEPVYSMTNGKVLFSTDSEGNFVPALHMTPGEDYWYFFVNIFNIKITEMASTMAPGTVQNIVLKADEKGERSVSITFNAPTEAYNGGLVESISKIDIFHESEAMPFKSFEAPSPGEQLTWTDSNVPLGYVKYAFITQNEYGTGKTVLDSVFVGADLPVALTDVNIKADANNANSTISWTAPLGQNNGYIDYNSLTYNIYLYDANSGAFNLVKENISDTFCSMEENITDELQLFYYAVSPVLNGYEAEAVINHVVLGTPYAVPYHESFSQMSSTTSPWVIAGTTYSEWTSTSQVGTLDGLTVNPQDNDEGMLFFHNPYGNGTGYAELPKVTLYKKNVASNKLRFWLYQSPELATENSVVYLEISANDNEFEMLTEEIPLNDGDGWTPHTYDLDAYKSAEYIKIRIYAYIYTNAEALLMDNINIYCVFPEDISATSVSGPETLVAGEEAEYSIGIQNVGSNAIVGTNYTVSLYNGSKLIETKEGVDLASEEAANIAFKLTPSVTEAGNTWDLTATVNYSNDQITSNNTSNHLSVNIDVTDLPSVNNLSAMTSGDVVLNWSAPNLDYLVPEVESFENYTSLSINNFGDWKSVDLDGQYTAVLTGLEYENAGSPMAFQIWNYVDAGAEEYSQFLSAHSGDQCMISWSSAGVLASDESPVDPENNDWLISKEITQGSRLGFWVKQPSTNYGNETFEVWASSTSDAVEDFILVDSQELITINWTYYSVQLPADAKYFAIRHTSACFALMIDDIELIPLNAEVRQYNLLGYNVYRNSEKVNSQLVTETTYNDTPATNGSYSYAVNASYDKGESAISNIVVVDYISTGINPEATQKGLIIGGKGQITVKDLQGKNIRIYTVDGVQVDAFVCNNNHEIRYLSKGIYLVTVENMELSSKIAVY